MAVLLRPVSSADDPVLDRIAEFYAEADRDNGARAALVLSGWPLPGSDVARARARWSPDVRGAPAGTGHHRNA